MKNLAVGGAPGVVVKVDHGPQIRRGGGLRASGTPELLAPNIVDGFQYSPLIIRRQDIESFWRVPEIERQAFFFDYLRDYQATNVVDTPETLRKAFDKAETEHAIAVRQIISSTSFTEHDLPVRHKETRKFFEQKMVPGYGVRQKPSGLRRVPARLHKAFLIFQSTLKTKELLADKIRNLPEAANISGSELTRILRDLTIRVTTDFTSISRLTWIKQVVIVAGAESELSITLILNNGREADPTQLLSEASLDLLALLILVEVHIECAALGQSPVIVLDDVFQSVDTVNRIRTLDHILMRLKGWQIIITLHDRLWLELARRSMQRANHDHMITEVLAGEFGASPQLRGATGRSADELQTYVNQREGSEVLAGCAGRVLEELCEGLSIKLACKIARRPGDRYTLGDLWPGVASSLKKHGPPSITPVVDDVGRFLDLRNIVGAHYNEWAGTLASQEALEFANAALALWNACRCPTCGSLFSKFTAPDGKPDLYSWPCDCRLSDTPALPTPQPP